MRQKLKTYIPIILLLLAVGIPSRLIPDSFPDWYVNYAGDFLWAMMVFFLFCLFFRWGSFQTFIIALLTTYLIEVSQLFQPDWLNYLRSFKLIGLVIGYSFIWSDIVAYTLGISLGAIIDGLLLRPLYQIHKQTAA